MAEKFKGKLVFKVIEERDIRGGFTVYHENKFWYLDPQSKTHSNLNAYVSGQGCWQLVSNSNILKLCVLWRGETINVFITNKNYEYLLKTVKSTNKEIQGIIKIQYHYRKKGNTKSAWCSEDKARQNVINLDGGEFDTWETKLAKPFIDEKMEADDVEMYFFKVFDFGRKYEQENSDEKSPFEFFSSQFNELKTKDKIFRQLVSTITKSPMAKREVVSMNDEEAAEISRIVGKNLMFLSKRTNLAELNFDDKSKLGIINDGSMYYMEESKKGNPIKKTVKESVQIVKYLIERRFF